jgi:hydroxymethylpyrimidine pyrophosphatase-like HAD family hydrolase
VASGRAASAFASASIWGMRPTLIACDLDGTLLCSDGTLDERTCHALATAEAAGATLVLCTARPARWLRPLAQATGHHGIAICANGGVVWDLHAESVIESFPLQPHVALEVVSLVADVCPGGAWAVERTTGFGREPAYWSRWPIPDGTIVGAVELLVAEPAVKLMFRHHELLADVLLERIHPVAGHLAEFTHSNSSDGLVEISAAGVSKATGLARFCAQRGIGAEQVIAFGDMPNDLPMLDWAGHAVAVANAHPDVLAAADEVTAANDDAGVARVLERLFADRGAGVR